MGKSINGDNIPIFNNFDYINWWPSLIFKDKTLGEQLEIIKGFFYNEKSYYIMRDEPIEVNTDMLIDMCIELNLLIKQYGEDYKTN